MQNIFLIILYAIFLRNDFAYALGVQHRNLSIAMVLIYVCVAYINLIATGIVFNIRASRQPYWPNGVIFRASEMNNQCVWSKINHESTVLTWPAGGIRLFYSICMGTKGCHCRCGRSDRDDFTPFAHVLSHSGKVMRACHDVGAVWEPRIDRVKLAFAL